MIFASVILVLLSTTFWLKEDIHEFALNSNFFEKPQEKIIHDRIPINNEEILNTVNNTIFNITEDTKKLPNETATEEVDKILNETVKDAEEKIIEEIINIIDEKKREAELIIEENKDIVDEKIQEKIEEIIEEIQQIAETIDEKETNTEKVKAEEIDHDEEIIDTIFYVALKIITTLILVACAWLIILLRKTNKKEAELFPN